MSAGEFKGLEGQEYNDVFDQGIYIVDNLDGRANNTGERDAEEVDMRRSVSSVSKLFQNKYTIIMWVTLLQK